jgi:hypothetical protein
MVLSSINFIRRLVHSALRLKLVTVENIYVFLHESLELISKSTLKGYLVSQVPSFCYQDLVFILKLVHLLHKFNFVHFTLIKFRTG